MTLMYQAPNGAFDPLSDNISYSMPDDSFQRRLVIKAVEKMTGQRKLQCLYDRYMATKSRDDILWNSAVDYLKLNIQFNQEALGKIPKTGPLIVIANHPFGVLDGIAIGHILSQVRHDFKMMAHAALGRARIFRPYLIPIEFDGDSSALRSNVQSKRMALSHLAAGGALIIFPAGRVSTATKIFNRAVDDPWKMFPARLIQVSGAPVVPIYFDGQNGSLFHIVSKFSCTLREALILREVAKRIGGQVDARIGHLIPPEILKRFDDRQKLLDDMRAKVYSLAKEIGLNP